VNKKSRHLGFTVFRYVILVIWSIIVLFPIFWMVSTSIKARPEWLAEPVVWVTRNPTTANYQEILMPSYVPQEHRMLPSSAGSAVMAMMDSLIVTSVSTFLALVIGTATAYSISRYKVGGDFLPMAVLQVRMFPPLAALIPLLVMFSTIRVIDTYWVLILCYTGFTMPFAVWLMKSFIDEVPRDLEKAAVVDGCSNFGAIMKVTIPLIRGGLAATGLFVFIIIWSDFIIAFILTRENVTTLPVQLSKYFTATSGQLYGPQAAIGTIAIIPVIIFGLAIQRYLVRGLTFGAIKQ
jgi:multiple sugar transport system permease protein